MSYSQYYKHDFAIISSAGGLSAIYVVADFAEILHWIFQHKYFHKNYARSGTKMASKSKSAVVPTF